MAYNFWWFNSWNKCFRAQKMRLGGIKAEKEKFILE